MTASVWKERNLDRELCPSDFRITDARYGVTLKLLQCSECRFIYADGDELRQLQSLYEQMEDPGYAEGLDNRRLQMRWLASKIVRMYPQAHSALEVGAGVGILVADLKARGIQVDGVEPSHSLVEQARILSGVELQEGLYPHSNLVGQRYDYVFLVDVIEHVGDPLSLMEHCRNAMTENGRFIVVTPDISSIAARLLGKRWWHLRLAHVGYFNRKTMELAADKVDMIVENSFRPLWFFPISYLAERLAVYLPLEWLNRLADRIVPLRWLYERIVPLNIADSYVFVLRKTKTL